MKNTDLTKNFQVESRWEDFNGHMNVTGYLHYFNAAVVLFFEKVGFGRTGIEEDRGSFFAAQQQLSYFKEVHPGAHITITLNLLEMDRKGLHFWLAMREAESDTLVATMESIAIYVDMDNRRSKTIPAHKNPALEQILKTCADTPIPAHIGAGLGLNRKKAS